MSDELIEALRETIAAKNALIADLRAELLLAKPLRLRFDAENDVLKACRAVAMSSLVWHQNSGPFRGVCKAMLLLHETERK